MTKLQVVIERVRSLDVRLLLIVLLIVVSTGHVGRLFADREANGQAFIGYVLALCIDGVLAVSLYESANVRERSHRAFALALFAFTCALSGGFNTAYYRYYYPQDALIVSVLLGFSAPVLASLVAVLRAQRDAEREREREQERERERLAELERYRIEQQEQTRRVQIAEAERTKRERAAARAERAKAEALAQVRRTRTRTERAHAGGNGRVNANALDDLARVILAERPDIGPRPLARELGCSPSTAAGVLRRVRGV